MGADFAAFNQDLVAQREIERPEGDGDREDGGGP